MGLMDKLAFWRKEPDFDFGKGMGDSGGSGLGDMGGGKESGFGMDNDTLGLGKDSTSGLGGTGDLSSTGPLQNDISLRGPGFEKFEEPATLKPSPLERKPVYYQETQQSSPYAMPMHGGRDLSKDIEVISAKLDSIKSMLDMMNHRLDAMERQQPKRGRMEW